MIILWLLVGYFLLVGYYLLAFAVASQWHIKPVILPTSLHYQKIAILIPVYKADDTILETASHAMQLEYPKSAFEVVVIADSLKPETETQLKRLGCKVVGMTLQPRSKAKAINLALSQLPIQYFDICVVLDADNWLNKEALQIINDAFSTGTQALQGIRVAKSIDNAVENLEAISESINNNLFRLGHQNVGLPAALAGSGMAFRYSLFKELMSNIDAVNGFDKDLEFELLSRGIFIHFIESVRVYDEKVSSLHVLKSQRRRWFAAQIINIGKGLKYIVKKPSLAVIDKWWQMWLPSRLLLAVGSLFITLVLYAISVQYVAHLSLMATIIITVALLLATPKRYINKRLIASLKLIPASALALMWSMLSLRQAFKGFIHTPHAPVKK